MCVACGGGCVSACMRACVHVCVCMRIPMFSNDACIGLGYDFGMSRTILGNMITHAYSIQGPCSYFQCVM